MSLFGQSSFGQPTNFGGMAATTPNPMKDVEITNPPDDSISCLRFSPPSVSNASFLVAGSWDNNVRCWQIQQNGQSDPKSQQTMQVNIHVNQHPFPRVYTGKNSLSVGTYKAQLVLP